MKRKLLFLDRWNVTLSAPRAWSLAGTKSLSRDATLSLGPLTETAGRPFSTRTAPNSGASLLATSLTKRNVEAEGRDVVYNMLVRLDGLGQVPLVSPRAALFLSPFGPCPIHLLLLSFFPKDKPDGCFALQSLLFPLILR